MRVRKTLGPARVFVFVHPYLCAPVGREQVLQLFLRRLKCHVPNVCHILIGLLLRAGLGWGCSCRGWGWGWG